MKKMQVCMAKIEFPVAALKYTEIRALVNGLCCQGVIDGIVCYADNAVPGGEFVRLEQALKARGIPFDRHSQGCGVRPPRVRRFRPAREGYPGADVERGAHDVEPVVSVETVKRAVREGRVLELYEELERHYPDILPLSDYVSA